MSRSPRGALVLPVVALLVIVIGALESMTIPVLSLIGTDLALTPAQTALIPATLVITGAIATPLTGCLADRLGGRRVLVTVSVVVAIGAAVSAAAPSFPLLLAGQALQGIGAGVLPLGFVLLQENLANAKRTVAVGVVTGVFVIGGTLGVVLAGPIAESLSWRWMYALPAIVIAAGAIACHWAMPASAPAGGPKIDWAGGALLAVFLFALMTGLTELPALGWTSPVVLASLGGFAVLAVLWVLVERRSASPLVDLGMLGKPGIAGGILVAMALGAGYAMAYLIIPQIVVSPVVTGYGLGGTPSDVGLYLLPGAALAAVAGPVAGGVNRRFGSRATLVGGLAITVAGCLCGAWLHHTAEQLILLFVLLGIGVTTASTALINGTVDAVPPEKTGAASGLNIVARAIGVAIGFEIAGAILTGTPAFETAFLTAAALAAAGVLVARALPKGRAVAVPAVA
ncbi:MFS transporter [Amycolatopsis jejuensis]|uniref:MFS transporter n=1 Tax=Amycolatopsis jejuensis TaxID=330084 RepID=UPI0005241B53|nr:MFS transporter [Amycolatopsis jejuensis]